MNISGFIDEIGGSTAPEYKTCLCPVCGNLNERLQEFSLPIIMKKHNKVKYPVMSCLTHSKAEIITAYTKLLKRKKK